MRNFLIAIFLLGGTMFLSCQEDVEVPEEGQKLENEIFIWENTRFENRLSELTEIVIERPPEGICEDNRSVKNIANPSITPYLSENPNGASILICPGGGYAQLAFDKEGTMIARFFNQLGISAFVLKYRLPDGENAEDIPLQDAQRAIRYIKANANEFNLDANKVGVIGFSAGGHLAATLSTGFDKQVYQPLDSIDTESARPAFSMLIYPVISMEGDITHQGSRNLLLGENASLDLIQEFSLENQVTEMTPPSFLAHAKDDSVVVLENSQRYSDALIKAKVNSALFLYENGGHGGAICQGMDSDFRRWVYDGKIWLEGLEL